MTSLKYHGSQSSKCMLRIPWVSDLRMGVRGSASGCIRVYEESYQLVEMLVPFQHLSEGDYTGALFADGDEAWTKFFE